MSWLDDLDVLVYISTSGDYVSLGTRTDYPFSSGGTYGVPQGWTPFIDNGGNVANVNMSVGLGRFNISNAMTDQAQQGFRFGAYRDFPVTVGKRYIFQVQCRIIEGKTEQGSKRYVTYSINPSGTQQGAYGEAQTDWEQFSFPVGLIQSGKTSLRLMLQALAYDEGALRAEINWGIQYQNVALIEQDNSYPAPTWDEVTCDVQALATRFGRDRFTSRYDVASMTLSVLNNDGHFTYKPNGVLRPGRFIKVLLREKGTTKTYPHFYGLIDSLSDGYSLDGRATSVISAIDTTSLLSNQTVPTASWDTNTYLSGARFDRLLDAAGWRANAQKTGTGVFNQQPILANGRTIRDELGLIADSEGGYFFADREGDPIYEDRNWKDPEVTQVTAELLAYPFEEEGGTVVTGYAFEFPGIYGNNLSAQPKKWPTGSLDLRVRMRFDSYGQQYIATKYNYPSTPLYNDLTFYKYGNSFTRYSLMWAGYSRATLVDGPYGPGQTHWVRAVRSQDTGGWSFYTAPDNESEPTTWVQIGSEQSAGVAWVPPVNSPIPLKIGEGYGTGTSQSPFDGRIFRTIIRDGINGPIVLDVSDDNVDHEGQTAFVGTTGDDWVVNQTAGQTIVQEQTIYIEPGLPVVDTVPDLGDPPVICLRELEPEWSRDRVINDLTLANQGGTAFTVVDADSQRRYGPRAYQRLDYLNVDSYPEYLATRANDLMTGYTEAILRVNSVRYRPRKSDRAYTWSMSAFLNWLVRVRYQHPSEGWGFAVVSHVQGLEHNFSLADWEVSLMLDNPVSFVYWETPDLGTGWDIGGWDDDIWDGAADPNTAAFWDAKYPWSDPVSKWG